MRDVCYVLWSECEIGDGYRPEGYTMKEVHAVFVLAGLKKPKTPTGDNGYHDSGFLYSLLSCAFCFRLQARSCDPHFTENEPCESRLVQSEMLSDDNNEMAIRT